MGIETIIAMIPKGGKYAKSVVNFVHKVPQNWEKFKSAIQQIDDVLKQGKLKLDGKQKTIFESNKNILKNHEKVTKDVIKDAETYLKKEFSAFNVSKEDPFKGWKPTVYERQNLRNIYKELDPPASKYTKEMEAIDEELNELMVYQEGKYKHLNPSQKEALYAKLQAEMKKLIDATKKEDLTTLSLSQINKKSHDLQKRIREIADNPDIKGTVSEGPKRDMIKALYDSENAALTEARTIITRKNSIKKYGDKFPVLDPENDAFIVFGLDSSGNPMKMSRFLGRFSATKDTKTGDLTRKEGTAYYDTWDPKKNQMRKANEEMWHETVDAEGKTIMSNPDYKLPQTGNMEIWNEIYSNRGTSDLAKKGFKLKDIDMLIKGREVSKYLKAQEAAESKLDIYQKMHERTESNVGTIGDIMEDLYHRSDDIYKMTMKEWITKIPEYFAEGGRTGFRNPGLVTKGIEKGMQLKRLLSEGGIFAALIAAMEAGTIGLDEALKMLGKQESDVYKPSDFYKMYKEYMAQRELLKRYEVFKTRGGPEMHEDYKSGYYKEQMPKLYSEKEYGEPKDYVYPTEKRNEHATGGVSNLFRQRQNFRLGNVAKLPEFLKFVERLLIKASNEIRQGIGKWKGLTTSQKVTQHDNLTKLATEFQKTKKFDVRINEYTGIDAEKAFIEAQAQVKKPKVKDKYYSKKDMEKEWEFENKLAKDAMKQEDQMIDKALSGMDERTLIKIKYPGISDDLLKKILIDDNPQRKAEVLATMDEYLKLREVGKSETEAYDIITKSFDKKIPTKHASGGLIDGYATGGVSNLFRSR